MAEKNNGDSVNPRDQIIQQLEMDNQANMDLARIINTRLVEAQREIERLDGVLSRMRKEIADMSNPVINQLDAWRRGCEQNSPWNDRCFDLANRVEEILQAVMDYTTPRG